MVTETEINVVDVAEETNKQCEAQRAQDSDAVLENSIRFAMNAHICQD